MWRLAVLVLVAVVLTPSQFRKFFVALLAFSLLFGTAVYRYNEHVRQRTAAVVSLEEVELENLVLDTSFGTYLRGRLANHSRDHVLREAEVRIRIHDCATPDLTPECSLLSTQTVSLYGPVPPGTSKPFGTNIVVPPARGSYPVVTYEVLSTKGK